MKLKQTLIAITFIIIINMTSSIIYPCAKNTVLIGCIQCDNIVTQIRIFDTLTNTYFCSDELNCTLMKNQTCITCNTGFYLASSNNSCTPFPATISINCIQYNQSLTKCTKCSTKYKLVDGNCFQSILNCLSYNQNGTCNKCTYDYLEPSNNCKIFSSICKNFDYSKQSCLQCPVEYNIHSSGSYCIKPVLNCLQYEHIGCIRCEQQFAYNSLTKICEFTSNILYNNMKLYDPFNQTIRRISICIQYDMKYDQSTSKCELIKNITQCNDYSYFNIANNKCTQCNKNIEHCINCYDSNICLACQVEYFLTFFDTSQVICTSCSVYGCRQCQLINNTFQCLSCSRDKVLYNNTCIACQKGQYFHIIDKKCLQCPLNCTYCKSQPIVQCIWCVQGYVLNKNGTCEEILTISQSNINLNSIYQIFIKNYPQHQNFIYKNSIALMSSCQQSANLYSCICSDKSYSTLCYNIDTLNTNDKYNLSQISTLANINTQKFVQNTQILTVLSELDTFGKLVFEFDYSIPITQNRIAALLQIYTNMLRRINFSSRRLLQFTNKNQLLNQIFTLSYTLFPKLFTSTETTTIYGNGYYLKYYPSMSTQIDNNQQFIIGTNAALNKITIIYVWFDIIKTSLSLTGNIAVFSQNNQDIKIKIKQLSFPSTNYQKFIKQNGQSSKNSILSSSNSFLTLSVTPITTTTSTNITYYTVSYTNQQNLVNEFYFSQRIQNIFYQSAFVYILIFLVLYLFLIPFCSIVDLCKNSQGHRRKRVKSQDLSVSNGRSQENYQKQQPKQQIFVNYRDFFPLYNISNTPRPRRIVKLCLFLINLQHSITFLTLIYFNLSAGHPVLAVVLGLPVYFCTILMGYICGLFTLYMPSFTKYLINLVTVGYWLIWIVLMPRFESSEYHPYVFVFAIAFFFIDMLIDLLQTFMVYFTINQSQKQIKMFQCLAAWLSKRGFYQYDKLAKQLV